MKHQETLRSSSSRRSTPTHTTKDHRHHHHHRSSHHVNIGCMAGILQLVQSKYHTRRKFLTFGKKHSKQGHEEVSVSAALTTSPPEKTPPPSSPPPPPSQPFKSSKKQKPAANTVTSTPSTPPTRNSEAVKSVGLVGKLDNQSRELHKASSCEAVIRPRSPPISAEIRRSQSNSRLNFDEENQISTPEQSHSNINNNGNQSQINNNQIRGPPALVARLMGLDEFPVNYSSSPRVSTSSSVPSTPLPPDNINLQSSSAAAEKRRRLLGALERCDEDLMELGKVIEVHVRSKPLINQSEKSSSSAAVVVETDDEEKNKLVENVVAADNNNKKIMIGRRTRDEISYDDYEEMATKIVNECEGKFGYGKNQDQEQSPVSVLDQDLFQTSPLSSGCCNRKLGIGKGHEEQPVVQQKHCDEQHQSLKRKLREEYCITNNRRQFLVNKSSTLIDDDHKYFQDRIPVFPPWRSKALTNTVNEVCKDIAWGQRRELGIITLLVHDGVFKDLVDEIVSELGGNCHGYGRLQSYKRKLCF